MKIRKNFLEGLEQKVYIHENKKDEFILIAVPDIHWSYSYTYEEDDIQTKLFHSLEKRISHDHAKTLSSRIVQWTREM
ncbi:hypothetical protein HF072_21845 [Bacillus sp. RO3]|nr:hypothetical protein [Bacillus sp. RO3]